MGIISANPRSTKGTNVSTTSTPGVSSVFIAGVYPPPGVYCSAYYSTPGVIFIQDFFDHRTVIIYNLKGCRVRHSEGSFMKLYSPKNYNWYDQMIKNGYAERDEDCVSVFSNGNPSDIFIKLLFKHGGKKRRVLDIGCGPGKYTVRLSPKYETVTGLDLSEQSINLARSQHPAPNVAYIIANSKKLPFNRESFDVIFTRLSPHNLDEMYRILRPKGIALCMRVGETDGLELRKIFKQETATKMRSYVNRGERHSTHIVKEWEKAGFKKLICTEHEYDMCFKSLNDLAKYLMRIPIVPEFDLEKPKHMQILKKYIQKYGKYKNGAYILHRHRYIIQGQKA